MTQVRPTAYQHEHGDDRTPDPPAEPGSRPREHEDTFVIHEHHARSLHWDLRLERGGVLVSWALPKGPPPDPRTNRLAIRTDDHPLDYGTFEGLCVGGAPRAAVPLRQSGYPE
jgi:bifunctional non-homologous end joining protein LigD